MAWKDRWLSWSCAGDGEEEEIVVSSADLVIVAVTVEAGVWSVDVVGDVGGGFSSLLDEELLREEEDDDDIA